MRARALKDTLQFLGEHRPGLASTMEVDAPPEALCSIREALPMEWIPASLSRGLIEVVVAELGEARAPEVWRDLVNFTMRHSPVIGPLDLRRHHGGSRRPVELRQADPAGLGEHLSRVWRPLSGARR